MTSSFDNNILTTICFTQDEGLFIAKMILQLPKDASIAVLFRQNSNISIVETELARHNIPYIIMGGRKFFSIYEVKVAIAYCKALFSKDILALELMLKVPKKGLGLASYKKVVEYIEEHGYNIVNALKYIKANDFSELVSSWINASMKSKDLFLKIWKESGCEELYPNNSNINLLAHKIGEFDSIAQFCENYFMLEVEEVKSVNLLTIHMAKGLEFDYVFMPFMTDGIFPNYRSFENLEEERRIAYVGITRAKYKIFFSYSFKFDRSRISRFLTNLPRAYITYIKF